MSEVDDNTPFVSDSTLTEQQYLDKYLREDRANEEYLKLRHSWMKGKTPTQEMVAAYQRLIKSQPGEVKRRVLSPASGAGCHP